MADIDSLSAKTAAAPNVLADSGAVARRRAFHLGHLIVVLICWVPLNPILVETWRRPNLQFRLTWESFCGVLSMVCGPFAPRLFYASPEISPPLILIASATLAVAILIQILWRPRQLRWEAVRLLVWGIGCWIWLCSAFVAFVMLM